MTNSWAKLRDNLERRVLLVNFLRGKWAIAATLTTSPRPGSVKWVLNFSKTYRVMRFYRQNQNIYIQVVKELSNRGPYITWWQFLFWPIVKLGQGLVITYGTPCIHTVETGTRKNVWYHVAVYCLVFSKEWP